MNDELLNNIVAINNVYTQKIAKSIYNDVDIDVLRIDAIDPIISGNKWFKLKYYLLQAIETNVNTLITFGGAWSNHIVAVAAATNKVGIRSIGIIRGERPALFSNTLQQAENLGMHLHFTSREAYANKTSFDIKNIVQDENFIIVPEGGYGIDGVKGASEILLFAEKEKYSHIIAAVGTGSMLAGLIQAASPHQHILGISVLKGDDALTSSIKNFLPKKHAPFSICFDYHFGGYAKKTNELLNFMNEWFLLTGMPTDFVYTAKLFFAVNDLIKKNHFPKGSKLLLIHSGGLQGNRSLTKGTLIF